MEIWPSYGNTGSTTDTSEEERASLHGNSNKYDFQNVFPPFNVNERVKLREEAERLYTYSMEQTDRSNFCRTEETTNGNGNGQHPRVSGSRSTFHSGSELTSDSDLMEEVGLRRDSTMSVDGDVFLPLGPNTSEQARILDQKRREIPTPSSTAAASSSAAASANGHSWKKRVADYVNALPSIPEPAGHDKLTSSSDGAGVGDARATQAKRQRIWSEGHSSGGRRRRFAGSGSQSFAEGMTPPQPRNLTSSTSSNLSQLSSEWSQGSSLHGVDSLEELSMTILAPLSPSPNPPQTATAATLPATGPGDQGSQTPCGIHLPPKPKALIKQSTFNESLCSAKPSAGNGDIPPQEGSASEQDESHNPSRLKPLLKRQMTNSELIAIASQHRQEHRTHQRRQNLYHMGSSNISDSSDTDISAHSVSSIDDLLIARQDPEEMLLNLGFGGLPKENALDRIPSRFLQQPSQAKGISVQAFLTHMDELQRGCGFSLVGGLRSLGSALQRSSLSPGSSLGLRPGTPSVPARDVKGHSKAGRQKCSEENGNETKPRTVIFPDPVVVNHSSSSSSKRSGDGKGSVIIRDQSATVKRLVGDSDADVAPLPQTGDHGRSSVSEQRTVKGTKLPDGLPPQTEVDQASLQSLKDQSSPVPSPLEARTNLRNSERGTELSASQSRICDVEIGAMNAPSEGVPALSEIPLGGSESVVVVKDRGSSGQPRPLQVVCNRLLDAKEDSFEFEELSSEERLEEGHAAPGPSDAHASLQENLIRRRGSTQSDSSGFSDEGICSAEMASPHQTAHIDECAKPTCTSDAKLTQTSFDAEEIELFESHMENLKETKPLDNAGTGAARLREVSPEPPHFSSVSSLDDSPFDDTVVAENTLPCQTPRTRASTYPAADSKDTLDPSIESILVDPSSLHSVSPKISDAANSKLSTRKQLSKLMKVRSVDPDAYGYKSYDNEWPSCQPQGEEKDLSVVCMDTFPKHHSASDCHCKGNEQKGEKEGATVAEKDAGFAGNEQVQNVPAQLEHNTESGERPGHQVLLDDADAERMTGDVSKDSCVDGMSSSSSSLNMRSNTFDSEDVLVCRSHKESPSSAFPTPSSSSTSNIPSNPDRGSCRSCPKPDVELTGQEQLAKQQTEDFVLHVSASPQTCSKTTSGHDDTCHTPLVSSTDVVVKDVLRNLSNLDSDKTASQTCTLSSTTENFPTSAFSSSKFEANLHSGDEEHSQGGMLDDTANDQGDLAGSGRELVCKEPIKPVRIESIAIHPHRGGSGFVSMIEMQSNLATSSPSSLPSNLLPEMPLTEIKYTDNTLCDSKDLIHVGADEMPADVPELSASSQTSSGDACETSDEARNKTHAERSCHPDEQSGDTAGHPMSCTCTRSGLRGSVNNQNTAATAETVRMQEASQSDHAIAREELRELLVAENDMSDQLPSVPSASHDEAIEDLKLLQRALSRYHQDLELLETWSARMYQDLDYALTEDERQALGSLSEVRHRIRAERSALERSLRDRYEAAVTSAADSSHSDENSWTVSLSQVMCEMVRLLKEQASLRGFLDNLDTLDQSMLTPLSRLPTHHTDMTHASVQPGENGDKSERSGTDLNSGGSASEVVDPLKEVSSLGDLTFPQVMTPRELAGELDRAQRDLSRMRAQAKQDITLAVREVRESIRSEVRKEFDLEAQLLHVQIQAKDMEIEKLRALVHQLKEPAATESSQDSPPTQQGKEEEIT